MLKEWRVRNFKSFGDTPTVFSFSNLNMVCGANSSGKSSLIQSILATAQTLNSDDESTCLILNGELVRLGFPSDVVHGKGLTSQLEIGFRVADVLDHSSASASVISDESLFCTAIFRLVAGKRQSEYEFELVDVAVRVGDLGILIRPDRTPGRPSLSMNFKKQAVMSNDLRRRFESGLFDYSVVDTTPLNDRRRLSEFPAHVQVRNFLPRIFTAEFDIDTSVLINWMTTLPDILRGGVPVSVLREVQHIRMNDGLGRKIGSVLLRAIDRASHGATLDSDSAQLREALAQGDCSLREWVDAVMRSRNAVQHFYRDALPRDVGAYREIVSEEREQLQITYVPYPEINRGVSQCCHFLAEQIRYLGPLRDDPRMIYSLPGQFGSMDVGTKGEFTAYVIDRFGDQVVECPMPVNTSGVIETKQMKLIDALVLWLGRMGLTSLVATQDRGKLGTELNIAARGVSNGVDLTSVGVGVSQVLPMLTMCLLAPVGSLILLEQPELHLHPKVQSLLADFLLGIARSGRQCIVETHSERMINRVRLRIAESSGTEVMDSVRMFFVEKPADETIVRPVVPNEYGAIPDWPAGFFDEGPDEAERIIKAASMKRRLAIKRTTV